MKVLADTSVWSLSLRRKEAAKLSAEERRLRALLSEAIADGRVVMIGPIRQELLSGIKDQAQFDLLRCALQAFRDEPLDSGDYEEVARMYNICRSRGVECGPVDILICAVAVRRQWKVLANDAGLNNCLEILASLSNSKAREKNGSRKKSIALSSLIHLVVTGKRKTL